MSEKQWAEYNTIYLEPTCHDCIGEMNRSDHGRLWCEDPQEPCDVCGKEWIAFRRSPPPPSSEGPGPSSTAYNDQFIPHWKDRT